MERLTKRVQEIPECVHLENLESRGFDCLRYARQNCDNLCDIQCPIGDAFGKLADYEDAEEQGRLIEFPVAIGDHVWCFPSETEHYREMQVIGLSCEFGTMYIRVQDVITCEAVYFNVENLGKMMFTTQEQAEVKLKELEADNGFTNN